MKQKTYVVYLHTKKGTNDVFYVGIGSKRRAYTNNKRNKRWYEVVEEFGYDVVIVNKVVDYQDAAAIETELIQCFGREDYEDGGRLVNIALSVSTTFKGRSHSEKTKALMSDKARDRVSHNKPISWKGRTYKSLRECSRKEGVPFSTVQKYVNWDKVTDCYIIQRDGN